MNDEADPDEYRVPVPVHETWWAPLAISLIFFAVAYFEFRQFEQLEAGTLDSVRVHAFEKLLYHLGGKWAAIAFFVLPALPLLAIGVYRAVKSPRRLS